MADREQGYVLGRTAEEYARLRLQARVWEKVTQTLLTDAGLAPGMRCLDAGSGPGEVMRLIGGVVGPEGHVTGLDADGELGRHAIAALHKEAGAHFAFVEADLTGDGPVPGAPFDLVFARLLLLHMADPVAAIRRLAALARPGGRLVLMDYDMTRLAVRPEAPAVERGFAILTEVFARSGRHADTGLRLPGYLAAAGLPAPRGTRAEAIYAPMAALGPMLRGVLTSLGPAAAALGVATPEALAEVLDGIASLERQGTHYGLLPLMIGVWTEV